MYGCSAPFKATQSDIQDAREQLIVRCLRDATASGLVLSRLAWCQCGSVDAIDIKKKTFLNKN
jgi:hypothetical protein